MAKRKGKVVTYTTGPEEFVRVNGGDPENPVDVQIGPNRTVELFLASGEYVVRNMRTGGVEIKSEVVKVK